MGYDIPFVPSSDDSVETMVKLAKVKPGELAIDLGAGDGKLVLALARRGAKTTGIEIDAERFKLSASNAKTNGLKGRVRIIWGSFWEHDLNPYDLIVLYGVPSIMERLEKKISTEAKRNVRVVSNHFTFPDWQPSLTDGHVHLYRPFS